MAKYGNREKIIELLRVLDIFPTTQLVRQLRKALRSELEKDELVEKKQILRQEARVNAKALAKVSRSGKLRKYHHYIRLIHDNFPDIPYSQIREQFKARKEGKEVSIPDVIWQNPSP